MQIIGELKNITQDILTGEAEVTFSAEDRREALRLAEAYKDKRLRIEVKKYTEKRSLTANGYYWTLVAKLAGALGVSNARCHNMLLRRYGQPWIFDGEEVKVMIPDTAEAELAILEDEREHMKPTSEITVDRGGNFRRVYRLLRGSHDYNREEFARLIDGTVDECKQMGLETLPPDELARMMEAYE